MANKSGSPPFALVVAGAVVIFATIAVPAFARPETGSRIDRHPDAPTGTYENEPGDLARLLNDFSRCFARDRAKTATTAMGLPLFSEEQNAFVKRRFDGSSDCLDDTANVTRMSVKDPRVFIGGVAEKLFLLQHAKADVAALVASRTLQPRNAHEDLALCIVRRNPTNSRALIDTVPGTDAEARLIRQLVPDIGPCVNQGLTLKLNKFTVRAYTAAGLYLATTMSPETVP